MSATKTTTKVVLVDDNPFILELLRELGQELTAGIRSPRHDFRYWRHLSDVPRQADDVR